MGKSWVDRKGLLCLLLLRFWSQPCRIWIYDTFQWRLVPRMDFLSNLMSVYSNFMPIVKNSAYLNIFLKPCPTHRAEEFNNKRMLWFRHLCKGKSILDKIFQLVITVPIGIFNWFSGISRCYPSYSLSNRGTFKFSTFSLHLEQRDLRKQPPRNLLILIKWPLSKRQQRIVSWGYIVSVT